MRISKEAFESVLEFIKDDISGGSRYTDDQFQQQIVYICHTILFLATDEVATKDAHTCDALLYDHNHIGTCCILIG